MRKVIKNWVADIEFLYYANYLLVLSFDESIAYQLADARTEYAEKWNLEQRSIAPQNQVATKQREILNKWAEVMSKIYAIVLLSSNAA